MTSSSEQNSIYTLDELCVASELDKRTIRFYIQNGVLDRPTSLGPNARYTDRHYIQIQRIKRLKNQGYSLQRIKELKEQGWVEAATASAENKDVASKNAPLRMILAKGLALDIDLEQAQIKPAQVGRLVQMFLETYQDFQKDSDKF